jgi:hypothetical protein
MNLLMSAAVELSVRAPQSVNGLADFLPNNFADFLFFPVGGFSPMILPVS